ncbi:MAG: hypothetical protein U9R32_02505 [Bacteroidota bacterium]|nr:hypothetical protein [Bacteroidota bacterium]
MKHTFAILLLIIVSHSTSFSQKNYSVDGYIKNMQSAWFQNIDDDWMTWNTIHNRVNLNWYAGEHFKIHSGVRTLLNYGEIIEFSDDYAKMLHSDNGFIDLTRVWYSGKSYSLHTNIDRAYIEYSNGNFQTTIGRQRINWGIGLVWNPNDIFNTFSYFNFDYEERPGSDAVKLQYYTSMTSSIQLVTQLYHNDKIKIAGKYQFTISNYDIQVLGGYYDNEAIIGAGWSGHISNAGFRGEATFFSPNNDSLNKALIATIDADYIFSNELYLHGAFLYNSNGTTGKAGRGSFLLQKDLSVKTLSLSKLNLFAQISYPITPLIKTDFSTMINPYDKSIYFAPGVTISLQENLYLLLTTQIFNGEKNSEFGDYGTIGYIRIKWNF